MLNAHCEKINLYHRLVKMDKIFMNLLSNAFKFTEGGGTISINIDDDNSNCFVEFKDSGVGITADKINIIFNRFALADTSSTRRYEGNGIGLARAKEFSEMHCGTIKVESKHIDDFPTEHSTTLILTLPRGNEHL